MVYIFIIDNFLWMSLRFFFARRGRSYPSMRMSIDFEDLVGNMLGHTWCSKHLQPSEK